MLSRRVSRFRGPSFVHSVDEEEAAEEEEGEEGGGGGGGGGRGGILVPVMKRTDGMENLEGFRRVFGFLSASWNES